MADRPLDPHVESALAGLEPDDLAEPPAPPSEVWDAIEAAVRAEADANPSAGAAATLSPDSQPATARRRRPTYFVAGAGGGGGAPGGGDRGGRDRHPMTPNRRSPPAPT